MSAPQPVALHWSGGKDSAHAMGRLLADDRYEVRCLLTTLVRGRRESSVHGIPVHLLRAQAAAVGLPLRTVSLSDTLTDYRQVMAEEARRMHDAGIRAVAFGDLEDEGVLRQRERDVGRSGLAVVEPLFGMSRREYMTDVLASGTEAITVVVDAGVLDRRHLGQPLTEEFVASLPEGCDPSGEAGEYHTFVSGAPFFRGPVRFRTGGTERVERRVGTTTGVRTFAYWRLHLH